MIFATFTNGVLHGPIFSYGISMLLEEQHKARGLHIKENNNQQIPGVNFYGHFKNGQAIGHFWTEMAGGGWLHGKIGSDGLISGPKIAYIYPDGKTALLGKFENRVMIEVVLSLNNQS